MGRYQRTSPKFWQDPKVRGWGDREKLLAQYLLTCQHRSTEGLFWMPKAYAAADLGWTIEGVSKALTTLSDAEFVAYDEPTETLIIRKALKYEAPAGEKQIAGAIARLADVPPSPLFALLRAAAGTYAPDFADALDKASIDGVLKDHARASEGVSEGYPPSNSTSNSISTSETPPDPDGSEDEPPPDEKKIAESFEEFWRTYPKRDGKKVGRAKTLSLWRRLSWEERRRAYIGARNLANSERMPKDPERFIRRDTAGAFPFDDWQEAAQSPTALAARRYLSEPDENGIRKVRT